MYLELQQQLSERIRETIQSKYGIELVSIAIEQPPDVKLGEFATPVAFELARKLRKAPKIIAGELAEALSAQSDDSAFTSFGAAGAGYLNVKLNRVATALRLSVENEGLNSGAGLHVLVEHTSINPNKAAHVGHLRNAILGDTFVRILRANGQTVDVQNYIDNTGVQVADVVVGFLHLENRSLAEIGSIISACEAKDEKFDYLCWDLYARVSQWYDAGTEEENKQRKAIRYATLHEIERGGNETAEAADLISTAVLRRHLETMLRLNIEYDFLPRESEILHLHFWELAFELLKKSGVLYFETEGKNKGCWVMSRPGSGNGSDAAAAEDGQESGVDEDAKVIVRSNGTVTYVGKDIAYHLWKFGLLGRDFGYKPFFQYLDHLCWISAEQGEAEHPHFGGAQAIYNVIDSRQSDPQANVIHALRGMGHTAEADRYTHFSYEMVALTPRCAVELGYTVAEEDLARPYIEVSGRKGFGVKADDLIDQLIAASRKEVDARQTERTADERAVIANQIAIGALRYFMLKFTRNSVIAFDFKDALSFEGDTGPYAQYAIVRARNIFRKAGIEPEAALTEFAALDQAAVTSLLAEADDIWGLWLRAAKRSLTLDQCIAASEPAYVARHVFQLAQEFNNFYHKHRILIEEDPARKTLLLATAAVALREMVTLLSWLGIEAPEAM
ncbi:arginine--tRNA ligase [Acidicapsa dinghuensis]|uniref:arginine--tRNA ligase n=1 Tax=Acidicapsa dinghuensis TaxID=2218256 RepID=A0ABW1EI04_9BACT|nr:arginine--tRNA ligase [Acidicapsa dinghuensis]